MGFPTLLQVAEMAAPPHDQEVAGQIGIPTIRLGHATPLSQDTHMKSLSILLALPLLTGCGMRTLAYSEYETLLDCVTECVDATWEDVKDLKVCTTAGPIPRRAARSPRKVSSSEAVGRRPSKIRKQVSS